MLYEYGKRTRDFFEAFLFFFKFSLLYFWGVFNKTIIPLALVGYEMIIANSYPTRACVIIYYSMLNKYSKRTRIFRAFFILILF